VPAGGQWRATQRCQPIERTDEDALTKAIIRLASEYGRYGYRRITAMLQEAGWRGWENFRRDSRTS